ncbi:MAG: SMC-Scp complex subunit ScpB [Chloroflexota bacterium]
METHQERQLPDEDQQHGFSPQTIGQEAEKKSIIEALLFVAGEPVTLSHLSKATDLSEQELRRLAGELESDYRARGAGVLIVQRADGFQMVTDPDLGSWIRRFKNITLMSKLSQPALETLSIIAYKQPATKLEVDQLRGVNSEGAIKSLLEKRLIKIVGKKESPGRPFLYGTTREFLQYFGLKNLAELPPMNDARSDEAA